MAAIYAFGLFWIVKTREIRAIQAQQDTGASHRANAPFEYGYRLTMFRMFPSGSLNHATCIPSPTCTSPSTVNPGMS